MSVGVTPYGEWKSPITGESFTVRSATLSQVRVDGPDTYRAEDHPKEDGRGILLCRSASGVTSEVLPLIDGARLPDVRTRVHEYGGRAYAVLDGFVVFSDGFDPRVYRFDSKDPHRTVTPLTTLSESCFGDFEIDEVRDLVYAVREDHSGVGDPVNALVVVPLDESAARDDSIIITVFEGTDFVASPVISPDGMKLTQLSWNQPEIPWTRSALHVGALDFKGRIGVPTVLADTPDVRVYKPRWTLDGDLIHVDDTTGWANLSHTKGFTWHEGNPADAWVSKTHTRALHPGTQAFSHPHQQLGLYSYDNFDNNYLVCSWAEDLTWYIGAVFISNGLAEEWATDWWPIGNVASADGRVVFLAGSVTRTPAIVEVKNGKTSTIRLSSKAEILPSLISPAQIVSWPTSDGVLAYGLYYPPKNPEFQAPAEDPPPLIVNVHGDPTFSTRPGLSVPTQYWTSRGFAVLDVNYRGSAGFDRAYRERLNGNQGVVDVQDCADSAKSLIERGLADPKRIAIRGDSVGGSTTLNALVRSDIFTAGTSFYGITDLKMLEVETHKFRTGYSFRLFGSSDLPDPVWEDRSPLFHIGEIAALLLLLQDAEDRVVLPSQAHTMYDALIAKGNAAAVKIYEGEGHGFRRATTIWDAWAAELAFYSRVWGLDVEVESDLVATNL